VNTVCILKASGQIECVINFHGADNDICNSLQLACIVIKTLLSSRKFALAVQCKIICVLNDKNNNIISKGPRKQ